MRLSRSFSFGAVLAAILALALVAEASNTHWSTVRSVSADNGSQVCKFQAHHAWTPLWNDMEAQTYDAGGYCVEFHVVLMRSGVKSQDYSTYYAETWQTSSSGFQYSDHNVDPLGPEQWIGFRMY